MKLSKLTKPELEEIFRNANFTEEEEKVFWLLAGGKSLEQISAKTFLPIATVNRRVKSIKDNWRTAAASGREWRKIWKSVRRHDGWQSLY